MSNPTDPFPWDDALEAEAPAPESAPDLTEEERATVERIESAPDAILEDDHAIAGGKAYASEEPDVVPSTPLDPAVRLAEVEAARAAITEVADPPAEAIGRPDEGDPSPTSPTTAPVPWVGIEGITAALDNLADLQVRQATIRPAIDTVVTAVRSRAAARAVRRPEKIKDAADLRREIVGVTRDGDVLLEMARVFTAGATETKGIVGELLDELPKRGGNPRASAKVEDGDGFELKITRSKRKETSVNDADLDDVLASWLISVAEERGGDGPLALGVMPAVTYAAGVRAGIGALRNVLSASPGYRVTALDSLVKIMGGTDEDELAQRLARAYGRVEKGEASISYDRTPVKRDEPEEPTGE